MVSCYCYLLSQSIDPSQVTIVLIIVIVWHCYYYFVTVSCYCYGCYCHIVRFKPKSRTFYCYCYYCFCYIVICWTNIYNCYIVLANLITPLLLLVVMVVVIVVIVMLLSVTLEPTVLSLANLLCYYFVTICCHCYGCYCYIVRF